MPILHSTDGSRIQGVLRSAERRRLLVLGVEEAAISVMVLLAGLILLLLLGTQILHWYWLAMLALAALLIGVSRFPFRPLAPYRLAQIIDRRLELSDSLSTAWFLLDARTDSPIARLQIERAEEIAESVRLARAVPFTRTRPWLVSGALAALAFALFTVRYLVTSSLSLEQALIHMPSGLVLQAADESRPQDRSTEPPSFSPESRTAPAQAGRSQDREAKPEPSTAEGANAGNPAGVAGSPSTTKSRTAESESRDTAQSTAEGQRNNGSPEQPNNSERAPKDSTDPKNRAAAAQPNSSNLLDNMKDALSSLLSKMRPNSSAPSAPTARQSSEQQHSTTQAALGRERKAGQTGAQQDQSSQQQSTEGDAQHAAAEKAQASQARSSTESSSRNGSDSRSGVGRQDGNKDLKEAEQLQALGKLEEIIGKRSADLTGDMTVETPSGKQQLKTEYSQRMGHHADLGGEINHDEIPLMYQQYIRDYMDAVRKDQERPSPP